MEPTPTPAKGKPERFFRPADWLAAVITTLVTLVVYAWTMPPTVTLEDAGELAVAADYLGVPHQPGYPIWSLLAWFFQWVFGFIHYNGHPNPAWGVALMSAFFGAVAAGLLAMLLSHSSRRMLEGFAEQKPTEKGNYVWLGGALVATVLVCLMITLTGSPSPVDAKTAAPASGFSVWMHALALSLAIMGILYLAVSVLASYFWTGKNEHIWQSVLVPHGRLSATFLGAILGLVLYVALWTGNGQAKWLAIGLLAVPPVFDFLLERFGGAKAGGRAFPADIVSASVAIGAGLLFALSPTTWSQSNIVEVYSLNTFFMAAVMLATYMWLWHPERDNLLYIGAFLFGLGLTNHQSLLFLLPFMLLVIAYRDLRLFTSSLGMVAMVFCLVCIAKSGHYSGVAAERLATLNKVPAGSVDFKELSALHAEVRNLPAVFMFLALGVGATTLGLNAWFKRTKALLVLTLFFVGGLICMKTNPFSIEIGNVTGEGVGVGQVMLFILGCLVFLIPSTLAFRRPQIYQTWSRLYGVLFATAIGLSFHLYMAFASEQNPPMNWSYARTMQGFVHSVTRGQYEKIDPVKNIKQTLTQLNMGAPHREYYKKQVQQGLQSKLRDEQLDARLRFKGDRLTAELDRLQKDYEAELAVKSEELFRENKFRFFDQMAAFFYQTANETPLHKFSMVNQYSIAFSLLGLLPFVMLFRSPSVFRHWLGATVIAFFFLAIVFVIFQYPNLDIQDLFIKRVQYIQGYGVYAVWIGYGAVALLYLLWRIIPTAVLPVAGGLALALAMPAYELRKDARDELHIATLGTSNMKGHDFGWQFGRYQLEGGPGIDAELKPGEPRRPDSSYPPPMSTNAVFFGGTDPGRFVPTYMIYSANVRPDVYLITQNALADNTYMNVMRDLYGERIWIPAQSDTNDSFREYIDKVNRGEIDAGAELNTEGGKLSVSGVQGVMAINAILSRKIFDRNRDHDFYVEESYPIPWMYPYLTPHGMIMKLNREPTPITAELMRKDFEFWQWYIARLKANPNFREDVIAQKTFSKLRSAIAGLYAARGFPRQAEEAFRQALDLYPFSPEAAMRMALVYIQSQRVYDAQVIAERLLANDPGNKTIEDFLRNTSIMKVTDRQRKALEAQSRLTGLDARTALKLVQIYGAMGNSSRLMAVVSRLLASPEAAKLQPSQFVEISMVAEMNKLWKVQREVLTKYNLVHPGQYNGLIELAVVELRDYREKGRGQATADAFKHLEQAARVGGLNARKAIYADDRFQPLYSYEKFQQILSGGQAPPRGPAPAPAPAKPPAIGGGLQGTF